MGNNCCSTRSKEKYEQLNSMEFFKIFSVLKYYQNSYDNIKDSEYLNDACLDQIFNDNSLVSQKFGNYFSKYGGKDGLIQIQKVIEFGNFGINRLKVQLLIEKNQNQIQQYPSPIGCLILIFAEKPLVSKLQADQENIFIPIGICKNVIQSILLMLLSCNRKRPFKLNETLIDQFLLGVYIKEITLKYSYLNKQIEQQFPLINKVISQYFAFKLMQADFSIQIPQMTSESYVLDQDMLPFMTLINENFQSEPKICRFYSSTHDDFTYEAFSEALVESGKKSLIVALYQEIDENGQQKRYVYTGYNREQWQISSTENDFSSQQFLIQFNPFIKVYLQQKSTPLTNYFNFKSNNQLYINEEDKIGFGIAKDFDSQIYRMWIDNDLRNQSQCNPNCDLNYNIINQQQLLIVEIWVLSEVPIMNKLMQQGFRRSEFKEFNRPEVNRYRQTWTGGELIKLSPKILSPQTDIDVVEIQQPHFDARNHKMNLILKVEEQEVEQENENDPESPCFGERKSQITQLSKSDVQRPSTNQRLTAKQIRDKYISQSMDIRSSNNVNRRSVHEIMESRKLRESTKVVQ